jgi:hypothetical protein
MLEKDFWYVSSMKQKMHVGIWSIWEWWVLIKLSTGWRSFKG